MHTSPVNGVCKMNVKMRKGSGQMWKISIQMCQMSIKMCISMWKMLLNMKNEYSNVKNDYQTAKNGYSKKIKLALCTLSFTGDSMHEMKKCIVLTMHFFCIMHYALFLHTLNIVPAM